VLCLIKQESTGKSIFDPVARTGRLRGTVAGSATAPTCFTCYAVPAVYTARKQHCLFPAPIPHAGNAKLISSPKLWSLLNNCSIDIIAI
jgi:hypothetical protein